MRYNGIRKMRALFFLCNKPSSTVPPCERCVCRPTGWQTRGKAPPEGGSEAANGVPGCPRPHDLADGKV